MRQKLEILMIFLFFLGIGMTNAQTFEWAKSIGGTSLDRGYSVAVDPSGNVYTTGIFRGTVDFDPNPGIHNLTSVGGVEFDIFIQKLDASGNFVWAKSIGGSITDYGNSIAVDASENVYVTGHFGNTVDFDPGAGVANLMTNGGSDVFVLKLDSNGDFAWAKSFGGTETDHGNSIAVDNSGNVYTTGYYKDFVDFDPGAGVYNMNSYSGSSDVFVSKLDSNGDFVWAKSLSGSSGNEGNAIAVDDWGSVYTTGIFRDFVDFDPNAGTENVLADSNGDIFISKLDSNGDFVWAKSISGGLSDFGTSIEVSSSGNVYTTGKLTGGGGGAFVEKRDYNGNYVWGKIIEGNATYGESVAIDASENIYTTGYFQGTVDFNPGAGSNNLTSTGAYDVFIQKLDVSGNFIWATSFGNTSDDVSTAIVVDASENIYTAGYFQGTVDFDPGTGTSNQISFGGQDVFVHKMSQCTTPVYGVDIQSACDNYTWIDNNYYTSSNNTATYTINGGAVNGCDSIVTLNLTINSLPNVSANATQLTICEGDSTQLTGSGAVNYSWDNGLNNGDFVNPSSNTTYTVTGTDANNCSNTSQVTINVNPMPTVSISLFDNNPVCVYNTAVSLPSGSPSGGVYSGTGVSAGTFNPQTSGVGTFDITYTYTNEFNCTSSDMTQITVEGCLGFNQNDTDPFKISPNPFSSTIHVSNLKNGSHVSLLDMNGKLVLEHVSSATSLILNTEKLENGIYFLQVVSDSQITTKKVVKQ